MATLLWENSLEKYLTKELQAVSLSMFRKNFIGIFHGSLSAKTAEGKFIINKRESIFDKLNKSDLIELYSKKDYRWNLASIDADIHLGIYQNISEAKYIAYTMPPFTTAYTLKHEKIIPKDYFAYTKIGEILVYDPGDFDDWYERAEVEVYRYFQTHNTNLMVIKGYGVISFDRDLIQMVKKIAILENSCKLLNLSIS